MATWRLITPAPADDRGPLPPHASPSRGPRRVFVWLERVLLVLAIVCLGYYTYVSAETYLYQAYENRALPIGRGQTVSQPLVVGLMTQALEVTDRMKVLGAGFNIHVAKPVQPAELAMVVASLAGRRA